MNLNLPFIVELGREVEIKPKNYWIISHKDVNVTVHDITNVTSSARQALLTRSSWKDYLIRISYETDVKNLVNDTAGKDLEGN